jgi:deoxyadenosine/deoxycytidine kinase
MPLTIAVAGMVGAGKSTLTRALGQRFGLQLALESVDDAEPAPGGAPTVAANPWLSLFYADGSDDAKRRYGLPLQLHFLATRFAAMRDMRARGGSWVLDRTWYEDAEVFARGLFEDGYLAPLEFDLYGRLYGELLHSPAARPPRLVVYLDAPLDTILERIRRRGRDKERDTPVAYWERLHARYERWIAGFRYSPVLTLDVRDFDLVADPGAVEDVAALVRERLERRLPQTELWPAQSRLQRSEQTAGPSRA